jgi:putative transposase
MKRCMTSQNGAQEALDQSEKQRIIAMVCSNPPDGRARWTVRLVAEQAVKRKLVSRVGNPEQREGDSGVNAKTVPG